LSATVGEFELADRAESEHRGQRIAWGEQPSEAQREAIERLSLRPSPAQLGEGRPPAWVAELPRCRSLVLPVVWLPDLRPAQLPAELDTLQLAIDFRVVERDGSSLPDWPGELVLPRLRRLELGAWLAFVPRGLRVEQLPALESFAGVLDARLALLDLLAPFPHLRALELGNVRNRDVFESMAGTIERLALRGGTRGFPLELISGWPDLRELELASMQGPIDCTILAALPRLAALTLSACKLLQEPAALLDAPALRRLNVRACRRPFDATLRAAFAAHGFDHLDIEQA
jgi:hypothetical protein